VAVSLYRLPNTAFEMTTAIVRENASAKHLCREIPFFLFLGRFLVFGCRRFLQVYSRMKRTKADLDFVPLSL
jgi:hypothetical protein